MQSFLFNLAAVFILSSCSSHYKNSFISVPKDKEIYTPEFLIQEKQERVFKVDIEVFGHQFGGILAIKKIETQHYRIALITEIGAKLLDFELEKGEMKVNYAIEQLDRKLILTILKQDFLILLNEKAAVQSQHIFQQDNVYHTLLNRKNLYYFINSESQLLEKTVWASQRKEKTILTYQYFDNNFPNIEITHKNIDLTIKLRLIGDE